MRESNGTEGVALRKDHADYLYVIFAAALAAATVMLLACPLWLGVLVASACALASALFRLHCVHRQLAQLSADQFEFTRQVVDGIPHPVYVKDAESRYLIVNRAFCDERGLPLDRIVGHTTQQVAPDPISSDVARAEDTATLAGKEFSEEKHELHPVHGGERHRLIMKSAFHAPGGKRFVVGVNVDISRWWLAEQDLQNVLQQERRPYQETFAFVQRVMDLIPHPVLVKDANGNCVMANRAMMENIPLSSLLPVDNGGAAEGKGGNTETSASAAEDQAVLAGATVMREAMEVNAHGAERTLIISKGSCVDARGEPVIVIVHVDLTEQRAAERTLQQALANEVALRQRIQQFIQSLIDNIPDPVFIKKAGGRYEMINEAFAKYRNVDKLTFKRFDAATTSNDATQQQVALSEDDQVLLGLEVDKEDHTFRQTTGEEVFRMISKRRSIFVDGEPVIVGVERHVTRWRIAERELTEALERETSQRQRTEHFVQDLIDVIPDPFYVKSADGRYIIVNEAFARRRRKPREELLGIMSPSEVSRNEDQHVLAGGEVLKEEYKRRGGTDEEIFRVVCKRRCVNVDGTPVVVGIDHYITEWRLAERELKRLAEEDVLTGIANRRHFTAEAQRALEQALRHGQDLALLMFDLDHFKRINDQYGHNVGDEVLREMSARMQACFRKSDLPGRWGGEEFIALLPHTSMDTAQQVADRLRERLADEAFKTSAGDIHVTLSGGGTQLNARDTLESLVARADAALYRAKHAGRNRIEISAADCEEPAGFAATSDALETDS